jgi:alcohol-forming fatty acyl-CoA reductase
MVKVQDKLNKAAECLEYFTTHEWQFRNDNVQNLLQLMSAKDRQEFRFDVSQIDWENYVEAYVLGFRKFLFKQSPASIIKERKNMQRLV